MRRNRCRQLRSALTSYVDSEVSATERLIVEDHLRQCDACRRRLSHARAVRQRLQGWSAEARAQGAPLCWPAVPETRRYASLGALLGVAALVGTTVIGLMTWNRGWFATGVPLTARGHISDSRCAGRHSHAAAELRNMSDRDCVWRCIEMGAQYVFISQGIVYPIRNQDFVDLMRLAGQDVQLEGEVRQRVLTVSHVRPLTVSRWNGAPFSRPGRVA